MKAYVRGTFALRDHLRVLSRQLIRRHRGGNQLDAGTVREFDVAVMDAVRVKAARLDDETQMPVGLGGLLQVSYDEWDVVDPNQGRRSPVDLWASRLLFVRDRRPTGFCGGQRQQSPGDELPPAQAALSVTWPCCSRTTPPRCCYRRDRI